MKIIVSHPTGNSNVRAVLSSFREKDILESFFTTIATNPNSQIFDLLPKSIATEFRRRSYPIEFDLINTRPLLELARNVFPKIGLSGLVKRNGGIASIDKVYLDLDRNLAKYLTKNYTTGQLDAIYSYEEGAYFSFVAAKKLALKCFYDLPIGYWRVARMLLEEERDKWPDWSMTLTGLQDSEEKLHRKDEELMLADEIFVASTFTANSLNSFVGKLAKIHVVPYGFPKASLSAKPPQILNEPLKVLYVGLLSQRKGVAYLFEAVGNLGKHINLTIVGKKVNDDCHPLNRELNRHTWIESLPHDEVLELMKAHDVLVFPSLFEGFGLVITEAMSQGTPVITTDRTAGPDIITNGKNGWIIEAGSSIALQEQLEKLLEKRVDITTAGLASLETAIERPWSAYGGELSKIIMNLS